jgi:hypothetical protein
MDDDKLFSEDNEVKVVYKTLAWGKIGDWFKGTLTDNTRQIVNNLSPKKEMQTIFEFKAQGGSFHDIIKKKVQDDATECVKGDFWSLITSKPAMLSQLKNAKLGQVIGLRFSETKEAKTPGYDDAKIIKVYLGEMDPEYQGEGAND